MARATVFNLDPAAQARAFAAAGLRISARGRSRRRLCRQADECAAVEAMLDGGRPCRCSSAAASATSPPSRPGSARASRASSSAPRRCAIPSWSKTRRESIRAASRSASTRATARSRSKAGRRPRNCTALDIARRFEDAGVAAIIFTDIARDGLLKGLNLEATIALAERDLDSGDRLGRLCLDRRRQRACWRRARRKLAGAIAGRALYDGRLDARRRRWR